MFGNLFLCDNSDFSAHSSLVIQNHFQQISTKLDFPQALNNYFYRLWHQNVKFLNERTSVANVSICET